MRLLQPIVAAAALVLTCAGDAAAQNPAVIDATKPQAGSTLRYRFTHVPDGVMRLDHQSGQVVFCKSQTGGKWLCNAVPEEGAVLKAQIQQAENDNSKLVDQLGELQKQLSMPAEERAALKTALEKAQAESAAVKGELAALREDIAAFMHRQPVGNPSDHDHSKLVDQLAELRKQLAMPSEERAALKAAIDRAQGDSAAAKSELAALRGEIAALKQQLSGNQTEQSLKAEIAKVRGGHEALATELSAKFAELRKDIAAIGAQVKAQSQVEAQRAEMAKLQAENKALNEQIATLQNESAAQQKRIVELEPPRPPAPVPNANAGEPKTAPQMPSKEDLDAARTKIVDAWRRVVEMLNGLARDLTGKSEDAPMRL